MSKKFVGETTSNGKAPAFYAFETKSLRSLFEISYFAGHINSSDCSIKLSSNVSSF